MKKIGRWILALSFGLGFVLSSTCNAQLLTAEVSTDSVLIGHYFQLRVTAENLDGSIEMPDFPEMDLVGGPNQSSSMQISNGAMSSSNSYTFLLKPRSEGAYTIDPVFWVAGDTTYASEPIAIFVWPNPDGIPQEQLPMTLQFEERTKELGIRPKDDFKRRYKAKKKLKVTKT